MPSTGKIIREVFRGERIRADDFNSLSRHVERLSVQGDNNRSITTAAGKFLAQARYKTRDPDLVIVQNNTGGDLTGDHPIVGLGDTLILPDDSATIMHVWPPAFSGEVPDEDLHIGKFAVLDGPVEDEGYQVGVVSGMAWIRVEQDSNYQVFADIIDGDTQRLITKDVGAALVFFKQLASGDESWALCRLIGGGS